MRHLKTQRRGSPTVTPTADAHVRRRLRLPASGAALVVSIVALVVAMGGSAYAGVTLLARHSVGSRQLKNGAVTNRKIAKGAISARKLAKGLVVPSASHANT
jgi:hypothetical protein